MSDWAVGDKAVCIVPVGDLQLGCIYTVSEVVGRGRYMRDGMMGEGLSLQGQTPPYSAVAFDPRRFLRGEAADGYVA